MIAQNNISKNKTSTKVHTRTVFFCCGGQKSVENNRCHSLKPSIHDSPIKSLNLLHTLVCRSFFVSTRTHLVFEEVIGHLRS